MIPVFEDSATTSYIAANNSYVTMPSDIRKIRIPTDQEAFLLAGPEPDALRRAQNPARLYEFIAGFEL